MSPSVATYEVVAHAADGELRIGHGPTVVARIRTRTGGQSVQQAGDAGSQLRRDHRVRVRFRADRRPRGDQRCVEGRACPAPGEVQLQLARTARAELAIQVVAHLRAGLPAPHRDPCPDRRSRGVRQLRHEHHPPAPDPLLRARQPDAHGLSDLRGRQPLGVVHDDRGAVDRRHVCQRVEEVVALLGALDDHRRIDRVRVVAPSSLHQLDDVIAGILSAGPHPVHPEVVHDPAQPGGQG